MKKFLIINSLSFFLILIVSLPVLAAEGDPCTTGDNKPGRIAINAKGGEFCNPGAGADQSSPPISVPAPSLSNTETLTPGRIQGALVCPLGYGLDKTICKKFLCLPDDKFFYDTNNKRCAVRPEEGGLKTGELQVGTTGYTPYICFREGALPTIGGECPRQATEGIAQYVARIYQFSLMIVGLLALAGLTLGAVKYILSAGNLVSQEDAREQMKAAVFGLLILLGAYLILNTINPNLVSLTNPTVLKLPPLKDTTGATPEKQSNLPANNPSANGQTSPPPGANLNSAAQFANVSQLPSQPGCANSSNQYAYREKINGQWYKACYAAAPGYRNIGGLVSPEPK